MRILFLTHRFGPDVGAGAERHMWSLASQMARLGAQVDVAAPLAQGIARRGRFRVAWGGDAALRSEEYAVSGADEPIRVLRFPVRSSFGLLDAWREWRLQRRWEAEEMAMEPTIPLPTPLPVASPLLLTGWHPPEAQGDRLVRWTMECASLQLPRLEDAVLHIVGHAPRHVEVESEHFGSHKTVFQGKGDFEITERLTNCSGQNVLRLRVSRLYRPFHDPRSLGLCVSHISLTNAGRMELTPFHVDHRTLRAVRRGDFIRAYMERAAGRSEHVNEMFDRAQGPRCPGMERFLAHHYSDYDWVLAGALPWSVIPMVARQHRKRDFRLALLPLFHVDDDFYYWEHALDALRQADCCLANSWFAEEEFYPVVGGRPIRAGAGVDAALFRSSEVSGERFRKRYGFGPDEKLVLTVGRKAASKMYTRVIRAIDNIQPEVRCRLVMVGPDEDRMPVNSPRCSYLGFLDGDDLMDAYDACDVFVLMSESESFGIVFVEAWMRGKAVIGNRNCAPVARLLEHDKTGMLAATREELESQLVELLRDEEKRNRLGQAGLERALRVHTWPAIARGVLDHFESSL